MGGSSAQPELPPSAPKPPTPRGDPGAGLWRQILERAISLGALQPETAEAALGLFREAAARGSPRSVADVLSSLGLRPRLVEILDPSSICGRVVGGFRLVRPLGVGGMGAVYLAEQESLHREVAVKILDRLLSDLEPIRERFRREAYIAARLDHPNVVRPVDYGEDGGLCFFAMEYIRGRSVFERLEQGDRLLEADALSIARDVTKALCYAEQQGIVHRDVKPANILIQDGGRVTLADLGLALDLHGVSTRLTTHGTTVGSPHYVSPEQALGDPVDGRADIYSLGITLYEMLCGTPPFLGATPTAVINQQINAPLPDLRNTMPLVSSAARALVVRMTEKRPEDRFQSAQALLEAIEHAIAHPDEGADESAAPPRRPPLDEANRCERTGEAGERVDHDPNRNKRILAAILVTAALAAATYAYGPWRREPLLAPSAAAAVTTAPAAPAAPDPAAEDAALRALAVALRTRRSSLAGYPSIVNQPVDPWTTAEALRALAVTEEGLAPDETAGGIRSLQSLALRRDGRFDGFTYALTPDTIPITPATADAALAVALVVSLGPKPPSADATALARDLEAFLLQTQNANGSWPTLPILGSRGAMTAATAMGLHGLCALLGARRSTAVAPPSAAVAAALRAGSWLAGQLDPERGRFFVTPRRHTGPDRFVTGLDERVVLALLELEPLAADAKRPLPHDVAEALARFASAAHPASPPPTETRAARPEDYRFVPLLPTGAVTSFASFGWAPWGWRLLVATELARRESGETGRRWAREAARLRRQIPSLPARFRERDTWLLSEVLFAAALTRRADRTGTVRVYGASR